MRRAFRKECSKFEPRGLGLAVAAETGLVALRGRKRVTLLTCQEEPPSSPVGNRGGSASPSTPDER